MTFDLELIKTAWPLLIKGFGWTIIISLSSIALGLVMGLLAALGTLSTWRMFRWLANAYVEVIRGTPFLIQVFLIYYALPSIGLDIPAIAAGILSLGLYSGAYVAEIFRGGVGTVPRGQSDSARALGMSYFTTLRRIIIPQIMGLILPPLANHFITLVKESSMLSVITVPELTMIGQMVIGITFSPVEIYVVTALLYWVFNTGLATLSQKLERNLTAFR